MANAYKLLAQTQPGVAAATVYTVPGSTTVIVRHIRAVNNDSSARTLTLYQGGTANSNIILPPTTIPLGGWLEADVQIYSAAGSTFSAKASVASQISLSIYGLEVS